MTLYLGPILADLHRQELLDEAAIERLGKLACEGGAESDQHRPIARLVAVAAMMAVLILVLVSGFDLTDVIQVAGPVGPRG